MRTVEIKVSNGVAMLMSKPDDIEVIIWDYDAEEDYDEDDYMLDENGNRCFVDIYKGMSHEKD